MRILFLTYDLPYPLDQGGKIRAYHLIKNLAKNHEVTLFSFFRHSTQRQNLGKLKPFCQKIVLFKRMRPFSLSHFLISLNPTLPFPAALYWLPQLKRKLQQETDKSLYDILHLESFYTSGYLQDKIKIPQVLGTENIEWQVYFEYAKRQKLPFFKYPMLLESLRIKWFEERTWRKADACLSVSQENLEEIEKVSGKKGYLIPNGVDLEFFQFRKVINHRPSTLLFVGNFAYIQNQDAVRFLVKEIFPLIRKEAKTVQLLIVGRNPTREIEKYAAADIKIRTDIEDIREAYGQSDILLAPIRAGSGTKFKVLEAMASGLPVVTTSIGIEGIKAKDGKEAIVRDDPRELAWEVVQLLSNKSRRQQLGKAGRALVEKLYDWKEISKNLVKVYQELVYEKKG